jgi:hypothetical protein
MPKMETNDPFKQNPGAGLVLILIFGMVFSAMVVAVLAIGAVAYFGGPAQVPTTPAQAPQRP